MAETKLTPEGKKQLEERLEYLKVTARREVAQRIKEARELGDISENAEYDAAKEEQAMIEGEIFETEQKLSGAVVLDGKLDKSSVSVGCKVIVHDTSEKDNKYDSEYMIVSTAEADPKNGKISNESPVGAALMGRRKNDIVEVNAPGGKYKLKIIKIG